MKSVLITGANRGLGLEFVRQLAASDATHIFAGCRQPDSAKELNDIAKSNTKVNLVQLDVSDDKSIEKAVETVKSALPDDQGLNLLINNAGILKSGETKFEAITRQSLIEHFNVNTVGCILVTQAFRDLLKKEGTKSGDSKLSVNRAAVVNISSTIGSISRMQNFTLNMAGYGYPTTKAAMNMSTKLLSLDLEPSNILVLAFCPGWVSTDMGGPRAQLKPEESITAMLHTLGKASNEHQGGYFDRNGEKIEY